MKTVMWVMGLCFCAVAVAAPLEISVENDHTNLLYDVGEDATFTVTVKDNGLMVTGGIVTAVLDNFGPKVCCRRTINLAKENPFVVKGKLDDPGFLRLTLRSKGMQSFAWSVGYDPTKIRKGSPSPEDFDAFWAESRAKLAREVPLDAKMTRLMQHCRPEYDYFRVSFATFGRRVYGSMCVPTDRSKAPFPVDFEVSAAGFGDWTNELKGDSARIKVFFGVYPWSPDEDWKELGLESAYDYMNAAYAAEYGPGLIYAHSGISKSREAYFFYPVLLGIDRAVDWLVARPDVDRSRFCYHGTSQGGGFGFYLTGLNHAFTKATLFVPAITDIMGSSVGRQSGWPQLVDIQKPENRPAAEKYAPYFDGANFASRIQCPVRISVGFSDTTCPPCAVYAAYNEIQVKDKGIVHGFGMTHACYNQFYKDMAEWRWQ